MDSLLKNENFFNILSTVSLAQFIIILAVIGGALFLVLKSGKNIKNFLEEYRLKINNQEEYLSMIQKHEDEIVELKQHHEDDMEAFYQKQIEYRQQSLQKQSDFNDIFIEIKQEITDMRKLINDQHEETQTIKRNELREKLLTQYRYYTSKETNPNQEWTEIEAEVFWQMYADYERLKGNGLMHSTVKPAMESLTVITVS